MNTFERILLATLVLSTAVLFGLLVVFRDLPSEAVATFIGVLAGTAIAGSIQYWLSESERRHKLRLAALDKRLQAHQEAYSLWRKLLFADKQGDGVHDVVSECQDWWETNCLYLSSEAREAFRKAYHSANDHAVFLRTHQESALIRAAWADVQRAGEIIVRGVHLPTIGEAEGKRIGPDSDDA